MELIDLGELAKTNLEIAEKWARKGFALYLSCFPDPDEREEWEVLWSEYLLTVPSWREYAMVEGDEVLGALHVNVLQTKEGLKFGVLEHLYVNPNLRRKKIASKIVSEVADILRTEGIKIICAEMNDALMMNLEELKADAKCGISTSEREAFWSKMGFSKLNAPYVQPPLSEGAGAVWYLSWCFRWLGGEEAEIDTATYLSMLRTFFETFLKNALEDPVYMGIASQCEGHQTISGIGMSEKRTLVQTRPGG
jgi:GNAT superfamily N-acetyltransferase